MNRANPKEKAIFGNRVKKLTFFLLATKRNLTTNNELNLQSLTMPFAYSEIQPLHSSSCIVSIEHIQYNSDDAFFSRTLNSDQCRILSHTAYIVWAYELVTEFTVYCQNNKQHAKSFQSIYALALTVAVAIQYILFMCNDIMSFHGICVVSNIYEHDTEWILTMLTTTRRDTDTYIHTHTHSSYIYMCTWLSIYSINVPVASTERIVVSMYRWWLKIEYKQKVSFQRVSASTSLCFLLLLLLLLLMLVFIHRDGCWQ